MPRVSVVVPIFNTRQYLPQCVDSLLGQTLDDIEIILVDDGSPDGAGEVADAYASCHRNIRVVHQPNEGLGPARNVGIHRCMGDYVAFVDSDDWVEPTMYERLYGKAMESGSDIVVSGHCDVTNGRKTFVKPHPLAGRTLEDKQDILGVRRELYGHAPGDAAVESFPMSVCMSLYRRSFIESCGLAFRNALSEDTLFNLDAYGSARRISFVGSTDYCYRKDDQSSITKTFSREKLGLYSDFVDALAALARMEPDSEDCMLRVRRTAVDYARLYVGLVATSDLAPREQRSEVLGLIDSTMFRSYCMGFPINTLPVQQRIFQRSLVGRHTRTALLLLRMRLAIKKGGR